MHGSFALGSFLALLVLGCFPRLPGPRLAHFETEAPVEGEMLPAVTVVDVRRHRFELQSLTGDRPLVVQLGSASCPVFRYRRFGMADLVEDFGNRVSFVVLYTREAHPVGSPSPYTEDEWDPWINRLTGARWTDTQTTRERRERAEIVSERLDLAPLVLVDPGDDPGWTDFGRAPSAAFVVDRDGRIVHRQIWVDPPELRNVLVELLRPSSPSSP